MQKKTSSKAKTLSNVLFLGVILLLLLAGLARTVFSPKDINTYENRYAAKLSTPTLRTFLDGTFQDGMDDALGDQVHLAQTCKKLYHMGTSLIQYSLTKPISEAHPEQYISFFNVGLLAGDTLVYKTRVLSNMTAALDDKAVNWNAAFSALPEAEFSSTTSKRTPTSISRPAKRSRPMSISPTSWHWAGRRPPACGWTIWTPSAAGSTAPTITGTIWAPTRAI